MRFENGRPRIDCGLGRYFQSLATSEVCDTELMKALIAHPDDAIGLGELPRRASIHGRTPDPITDGAGRAAAVSVAMVIMVAAPDGGHLVLMSPRSDEVATHRLFNHIAP